MLLTKAFKMGDTLINCDISSSLFIQIADDDFAELILNVSNNGDKLNTNNIKVGTQFVKLASLSLLNANTDKFKNAKEVTDTYSYMDLLDLGVEVVNAMFSVKKKEEQQQQLAEMLG